MANSFSTQGATPNSLNLSKPTTGLTFNSTPKNNALNSFKTTNAGALNLTKPTAGMTGDVYGVVPKKPVSVAKPIAQNPVNTNINQSKPTTSGIVNKQPINQSTVTPVVSTPTTVPVNPAPTYGGLVQNLAEKSNQPSQQYTNLTNQAEEAYKKAANFGKAVGQAQLDVQTNPEYSIDTGVGLGNRIAQNTGLQMKALTDTASGLGNLANTANTQQSLQQSGVYNAAGLLAPQQVSYSNQFLNPVTGQSIGGSTGGNIQSASQSIAQRVQNGEMSYDAGLQALSGYGAMAPQALLSALPQGFNVQASNANAAAQAATIQQTGTTGGQLTKSADSANQALDKLESDFAQLSSLQTGGIPATNSIANFIGGALGQDSLAAYQTTLADARAQLQGVLTASGGATPSGAEAMANTYLPDNMTPAQLKSKIESARELVRQKVAAFTNTSGGSSSNNVTNAPIIKTSIGDINPNF